MSKGSKQEFMTQLASLSFLTNLNFLPWSRSATNLSRSTVCLDSALEYGEDHFHLEIFFIELS